MANYYRIYSNLDKCAKKLKDVYNISVNESLYILMIDMKVDNIHKIEYEVYYNFSSNNLTKLNLTYCKDIRIDISFPCDIPYNEIDKYNKSSGFYNDICYTLTSNSGTDISLKDRQNEYQKNNLSICEEDCDFTYYNEKHKKSICSCFTKLNMPLISEIKVDRQKLFSNFKDIRNIGNFKMLSCIKFFFLKNNIFKNSANYMLIILFILNIISILAFIFYDKDKISIFIRLKKKKINTKVLNNNEKLIINFNPNPINNMINNNINENSIKIKYKYRNKNKSRIECQTNTENIQYSGKLIEVNETINNKKIKIKVKQYNDYILNNLEYEDALKKDNRKFLQLYLSLIKVKHLLLFSFFQWNDYNSQAIKVFIFFFTFAMNLVVSAMFYSDSTMHKIYIDDGLFDFIYQLPQMIYSFIISSILENLFNFLGFYGQNILDFRQFKNKKSDKINFLSKIKIKIILFFIISNILLFFFWIYLGCFCFVYKNTQIHLLIDVASSFAISFIFPFFVVLLSCIFRILSLKNKNVKRPILFKFGNFLLNF